jgi:hypothetical protein
VRQRRGCREANNDNNNSNNLPRRTHHPRRTAHRPPLTAHHIGSRTPRRSHVTLSKLRAPGEKDYKIPRGGLFNYVTCANYTFEIWGWLLFAAGTQSLAALLFGVTGAAQMVQWAIAKHKRLRKVRRNKGRPRGSERVSDRA